MVQSCVCCSFNCSAFSALLSQNSDWEPLPLSEDLLVDILAVSHMWNIKSGMIFAKTRLEELQPPFHPIRQLQLAFKYNIQEWIAPAVEAIVGGSLATLITNEDAEVIPYLVLLILAKAREALLLEWNCVALYPPPFNCSCQKSITCTRKW